MPKVIQSVTRHSVCFCLPLGPHDHMIPLLLADFNSTFNVNCKEKRRDTIAPLHCSWTLPLVSCIMLPCDSKVLRPGKVCAPPGKTHTLPSHYQDLDSSPWSPPSGRKLQDWWNSAAGVVPSRSLLPPLSGRSSSIRK